MSNDKHVQPIGGHIQRQHHELQKLVRTIGRLLSHHPEETTLGSFMGRARELMEELRRNLADHFAQEEEGGYMEEAVGRVPRLGPCVAMLEKQQPELLTDIDRTIAIAGAQPTTHEQWKQIGADFGRFARALLKHEDIENRILQEGFNDDLGLECENPLAEDAT
jgi:hypothetical protein